MLPITILLAGMTLFISVNVLGADTCCAAKRFTAEMYSDSNKKLFSLYVDNEKDIALESYGGKDGLDYVFWDEANYMKYVRFSNGTCQKSSLTIEKYFECVPSDAVPYYIPPGDGANMVGYRFNRKSFAIDVIVRTRDCVATYYSITPPGRTHVHYIVKNLSPTIYEDTVFDKNLDDC